MTEIVPKHVAERLERRWASRLAREAAMRLVRRPLLAAADAMTDRKGRIVPVTRKRLAIKGPEFSGAV
jgi:hypothetical protein